MEKLNLEKLSDFSKKIITIILKNELMTELQINCLDYIFIKEKGVRKEVPLKMNEEDIYSFIEDFSGPIEIGKFNINNIFEKTILLPDKSIARIHIVHEKVSGNHQITIARKINQFSNLRDLLSNEMFDSKIHNFLINAVKANLCIAISGATGTGKTTLLEALTQEIDINSRIAVIEDTRELRLRQNNVTNFLATELTDVTLSWAVKQALRQRVDKIIIGETRGPEFADFLTAANSGCDGSLTSIHANSAKLALQKMTNFAGLASQQSERSINQTIANTINLIIQLKIINGKNRIISIDSLSETLGNNSDASIGLQPIFKFDESTNLWEYNGYVDTRTKLIFEENKLKIPAK